MQRFRCPLRQGPFAFRGMALDDNPVPVPTAYPDPDQVDLPWWRRWPFPRHYADFPRKEPVDAARKA